MNKQMKQHLETVVNSIVNEDTDAAKAAFHDYLRMKTQAILMGEAEECDEEEDKKDDKEDKDESDDKDEKKSKKDEEESDDEEDEK